MIPKSVKRFSEKIMLHEQMAGPAQEEERNWRSAPRRSAQAMAMRRPARAGSDPWFPRSRLRLASWDCYQWSPGPRAGRSRPIEENAMAIHRWFEDYVFEVSDFLPASRCDELV